MPANYVLLEKITVGAAGAVSVTFSSIPQTGYTDLQLAFSPHTTRGGYANADMTLAFNGSSASFSSKALYSSSSGANSGGLQALFQGGNDSLAANQSLVFGPTTIYIPNYRSANYKSFSVDFTAEGNSSNMDQTRNGMSAGLWSNSAAITSITISPNSGTSFTQYSTFYLYGVAALGTTPVIAPFATGGSTIMTDGIYWYHTFISSGTFTPTKALTCDYLVVAGGAGGGSGPGYGSGGGGGAGGFRTDTGFSCAATGLTVTVGAGGAGGGTNSARAGYNGSDSVFSTITSTGGGGGGPNVAASSGSGVNGGSGGGGTGGGSGSSGGTGVTGQGNNGGAGLASNDAGGGGGAGAVGSPTGGGGGAGGIGLASSITGASVTYAAGGGGGSYSGSGGAGGSSIGGAGASGASGNATSASANTASGGGGARAGTAGAGGSGIVIVRYSV